MAHEQTIEELLEKDGSVLLRHNKHKVWLLSNGQRFTQSTTPSDHKAALNQLSDLKHALGLIKKEATPPKSPVKKTIKKKRKRKESYKPMGLYNPMKEQLQNNGVIINLLIAEINKLETKASGCLWCRFKKWVKAN